MPALAGLEVRGVSIGGVETCLEVPQYKLAFDIGRAPESSIAIPTVLFTHAHIDHMGGVAMHAATRALRGLAPPRYVVPRVDVAAFNDLFAVWRRLDRSELEYELVPLAPGDEFELSRNLVVRPFRSPHRAPCQGYAIFSRKRKLKPEFAHLASEEIASLRREGREVTSPVETCELVFSGDSTVQIIDTEPVVRTARRLILETTFYDESVSVEKARATGHVHFEELLERAHLLENEAVLLTHASLRHDAKTIEAALERLPASLRERVQYLPRP